MSNISSRTNNEQENQKIQSTFVAKKVNEVNKLFLKNNYAEYCKDITLFKFEMCYENFEKWQYLTILL